MSIGDDAEDLNELTGEIANKIKAKISGLQQQFRKNVRKLFRHKNDLWSPCEQLELDLFCKKVWQLYGFSRNTIIIGWAVASAAIGLLIDVATGGGTVGLGALIGGAFGVTTALLSVDKAVNIRVPSKGLIGPWKKVGGKSIKGGIEHKSKLLGILLDRMVCYTIAVARHSHGK